MRKWHSTWRENSDKLDVARGELITLRQPVEKAQATASLFSSFLISGSTRLTVQNEEYKTQERIRESSPLLLILYPSLPLLLNNSQNIIHDL